MNKTIPFTYLIGWTEHNIFYYGVRYKQGSKPEDLWTTYFTSSKQVQIFRERFGEPNIITIRKVFDEYNRKLTKEECDKILNYEHKVLRRMRADVNPKFLNLSKGGKNFYCLEMSEENKLKASLRFKGVPKSEATKQKMKQPKSEEHKRKLSETKLGERNPNFGKPLTEAQKKNLSKRNEPKSEEHKRKISEAQKGKPRNTPEMRQHLKELNSGKLSVFDSKENVIKFVTKDEYRTGYSLMPKRYFIARTEQYKLFKQLSILDENSNDYQAVLEKLNSLP